MALFDVFKKEEDKSTHVVAPATGMMIPAKDIPNPDFSNETLGQTIGIKTTESMIVCPVSGVVEVAFPTGHAFIIKGIDGNHYLVHIGIDTVSLNGMGFKAFLEQGQVVEAGQRAVLMDLEYVKNAKLDPTTVLIVAEKVSEDFKVQYIDCKEVEAGDPISL